MLLGPIASSVTGECFNLLSEEVATQLAIKLGADKLIGFCSEQGVIDDNGNAVVELLPIEAEHVIKTLSENHASDSDYNTGTFASKVPSPLVALASHVAISSATK